jgi:ADP-heptose:LPS heptosyltransferase
MPSISSLRQFIDQLVFLCLLSLITRVRRSAEATDVPSTPMSILLFKPDGIGDFILWSEVYKEFATRHPTASLTALVCAPTGELVRAMFPQWRVVEMPRRPGSTIAFLLMLLKNRRLRDIPSHDLLVDLRVRRGTWETLYIALLKSGSKLGFATQEEAAFNPSQHDRQIFSRLMERPTFQPSSSGRLALHELALVDAFCSQFWSIRDQRPPPDLRVFFPSTREPSQRFEPFKERMIIVHPGSGHPDKNWPPDQWRRFIEHLLDDGEAMPRIAIVAGKRDTHRLGPLRQLKVSDRIEWWLSLPLPELAATLARKGLFVGHDTGISHLAAAMGTPSVLLYGPTNPDVWGPPHPHVRIIRAPQGRLDKLPTYPVLRAVRKHWERNP